MNFDNENHQDDSGNTDIAQNVEFTEVNPTPTAGEPSTQEPPAINSADVQEPPAQEPATTNNADTEKPMSFDMSEDIDKQQEANKRPAHPYGRRSYDRLPYPDMNQGYFRNDILRNSDSPESVPDWGFRRRASDRPEFSEPTFTEARYRAHTDSLAGMYTPGINREPQTTERPIRRRETEADAASGVKKRSWVGGFLRAVCLVIVCALFSAGAAYLVIEYRSNNAYQPVINQVVLGSPALGQQNGQPTVSIAQGDGIMPPEYIYDMALQQVVSINIQVPTVSIFGTVSASSVSGSGFIISTDGYILTNFHVIEPALQNELVINVIMSNGAYYEAQVVGYEIANDVALLKIEATDLNAAILGNSDNIRVGQRVYAVGNPFGNLVYTMTDGIISALDRDVTVEGITINTFQFSAAVNTGNSGGPIYNQNGEVIGIVTAKLMRGNVEGIGFAIPINDAIEIASGLIEHGYIAGRPLLGITGQTVTTGNAEYYGWVVGVFVRATNPGSAAEIAGIEAGDIIIALSDVDVTCMDSLRRTMRRYRAGDTATLTVWRNGRIFDTDITFDEDLYAGQPRSTRPPLEIQVSGENED